MRILQGTTEATEPKSGMAVDPNSLKAPAGELRPASFPGEDLDAAIAIWQAEAEAAVAQAPLSDADKDKAIVRWVYYRGWRSIFARLSAEPAEANAQDQASRRYIKEQLANAEAQAAFYLAEYEAILAQTPAPPMGFRVRRPARHVERGSEYRSPDRLPLDETYLG